MTVFKPGDLVKTDGIDGDVFLWVDGGMNQFHDTWNVAVGAIRTTSIGVVVSTVLAHHVMVLAEGGCGWCRDEYVKGA